jgi:hypothetical protein
MAAKHEIVRLPHTHAALLLRGQYGSPWPVNLARPRHVSSPAAVVGAHQQRSRLRDTKALLAAPPAPVLVAGLPQVLDSYRSTLEQAKQIAQEDPGMSSARQGRQQDDEPSQQQQQQQEPEGVFMPQLMGLLLQGAAMAQAAAGGQPGAVWATYQQALPDAVRLLQLEEPLAQGAATVEQMVEWLAAALAVVGLQEGVAAGSDVGPLVHRVLDALVPELAPVLGQKAAAPTTAAAAPAAAAAASINPTSSSGGPRYAPGTLLGRLRLRGLVLGWHLAWGAAAAAWRHFTTRASAAAAAAGGMRGAEGVPGSSYAGGGTVTVVREQLPDQAASDALVLETVVLMQGAEQLLHGSVTCHRLLAELLVDKLAGAAGYAGDMRLLLHAARTHFAAPDPVSPCPPTPDGDAGGSSAGCSPLPSPAAEPEAGGSAGDAPRPNLEQALDGMWASLSSCRGERLELLRRSCGEVMLPLEHLVSGPITRALCYSSQAH